MLKTYSLLHDQGPVLNDLFFAYRDMVNRMLEEMFQHIYWKTVPLKHSKQVLKLPILTLTKATRKTLRDNYLRDWTFSAHWVDSALKTALSILRSWRKNYLKGKRKPQCPQVKRLFLRVKQTLMKLEGEYLRISLRPEEFVYISLKQRYFKLPEILGSTGLGEPIPTSEKIYLPIHEESSRTAQGDIAWDSNMTSLDGFNPTLGWVRVDTHPLATIHISSFEKRWNVQRKASKSKKARRRLKKYRLRERHRARNHQNKLCRVIQPLAQNHGFENLDKERMYTGLHRWNRQLMRTDWRALRTMLTGEEIPAYYSSKKCSLCGWYNKDLKGTIFSCKRCHLILDRQLNAAINLYLRMEGVPRTLGNFYRYIVRPLMRSMKQRKIRPMRDTGGYVQTGAEQKVTDEPARLLHEVMKPQIYIKYWKQTDVYLPMPM